MALHKHLMSEIIRTVTFLNIKYTSSSAREETSCQGSTRQNCIGQFMLLPRGFHPDILYIVEEVLPRDWEQFSNLYMFYL